MYCPTDKRGQQKLALGSLVPPNFPPESYSLIVADPPWQYNLRESDKTHRGRTPYPTMPDREILDLPITYLAQDDSYLLLWVTNNHLPLGFQCLERWGFEYKAIHTWLKMTKKGTPHIGIGHYGRNCTEQLIVATKGKPYSWSGLGIRDVPNIILAPRRQHSRKPVEFDAVCDRLLSHLGGKGIELFARRQRKGWDSWGLEVEYEKLEALP